MCMLEGGLLVSGGLVLVIVMMCGELRDVRVAGGFVLMGRKI